MKFNSFSKVTCQALRTEMNALLAKYGVEANLEFAVGAMKFSDESVEIKVSAKVIGGESIGDKHLKQMAAMLGLTTEKKNGKQLVSYNSRQYKFPFVYLASDGKRYKCTQETAKLYFTA